ncbi:hypothetical protein KRMM14A1004_60870 [Krasilnikovia sp. MM14-A1004]
MPEDIIVADNTTVQLDDDAAQRFAGARTTVAITRLGDLVEVGILDSDAELDQLTEAATTVTRQALTDVEVHRQRRFVPGRIRPDLGRYARLLAALPTTDRTKVSTFWRLARQFDPAAVAQHGIGRETLVAVPSSVIKWLFQDVTVNSGGTLLMTNYNAVLICRNLLIRANGRIVATGKSLQINATSIKGE